jgi:hypothetical protein
MRKNRILHPFLLAIYPPLFLYSHNIDEVFLSDIVLPVVLILVAAVALHRLLSLKFRNTEKAAVMASVLITLFFSFGFLVGVLEFLDLFWSYGWRSVVVFCFHVYVFSVSYALLGKTERDLSTATRVLNVISLTLFVIPVSNVIVYELQAPSAAGLTAIPPRVHNVSAASDSPDIYYLILDEYGREDKLLGLLGFNNSDFISELVDRGFYVPSKSRSNYASTYLSLASSLNMEYLNQLEENPGRYSKDRAILYSMLKNNRVSNHLKSRGYTYINLKSTASVTANMNADLELGYNPFGESSDFYTALIQITALNTLDDLLVRSTLRKSLLYQFNKLAEIPELPEPTFTFAHIMLPHPPYLFDEDGNPVPRDASSFIKPQAHIQSKKYASQLVYTNKRLLEVIDAILAKSEKPPVIILQADHGTRSADQLYARNIRRLPEGQVDETMAIFNAYYLPEGGGKLLYDSITPVNTFRVVLSHYFKENYSLLEDRSYFSNLIHPYDFMPVEPEEKSS